MGASKELFIDLREKEFTVNATLINTTVVVKGKNMTKLECDLREVFKVIDFKTVSDTNKLYETDDTFKKLVKAKKDATVACELYINKHN